MTSPSRGELETRLRVSAAVLESSVAQLRALAEVLAVPLEEGSPEALALELVRAREDRDAYRAAAVSSRQAVLEARRPAHATAARLAAFLELADELARAVELVERQDGRADRLLAGARDYARGEVARLGKALEELEAAP